MIVRVKNKINKVWAAIALFAIEMWVILVVFFLVLFTFLYLVRRVFVLKNSKFDQTIFDSLTPYVNETSNVVMKFFTFLGSPEFLIPANLLLIVYFLFIRRHTWYSIKIPTIALTSLGIMFILKYSFGRPRPPIPLLEKARGLSFPSGHALMSVTFYGLLGYIVWQTVKNKALKWTILIFFLLVIILIGFSRIYLRVHYTSDVIGGYCIGLLWLIISIRAMQSIEKYSKKKMDPIVTKEVGSSSKQLI